MGKAANPLTSPDSTSPDPTSPDPLELFSEPARLWFERAFERPTPAQLGAWPAIARGEHVLLCAPTGSGKTLAAFLWAIDLLGRRPAQDQPRTSLLYVSPLKALSYDVERNLRAPLKGIGAEVSVGIRTGDTPQRERAAMARKPPQILITTPESLYLMLTSNVRETLRDVETVIVDEIHAVASSKRGAHLALTLERLEALIAEQEQRETGLQRIGLSATQTPLEEVARFLVGPKRKCTIVDAGPSGSGEPPALDLSIEVPVESMAAPEDADLETMQPVAGGEALRGSIWPAIYPRLLELVQEHRSTIVFVNSRRTAERVAMRLNELVDQEESARSDDGEGDGHAGNGDGNGDGKARLLSGDIARAHHGSLSLEERTEAEELLKRGQLPCLVATSSLELGIDMGAVDLVVQISSPKSVASGLQRIGRAGHAVGEPSKGRIFPRYRGDLLECAVLAKRMREGAIERTVVPHNPLDVLAQQIVAMLASEGELSFAELHRRASLTYTYADLSKEQLENVLDMLDGRYPSSEFSELKPRIVWDRVSGTLSPREGMKRLAVVNAGTIPDRGLYLVTLPDGRRVGELDEEMVYEARPGQAFLLGASTWRIEEIGRDRVIVTPAPGAPGAVPFWKGDTVGRSKELGEAIGAFSRWAVDAPVQQLASEYDLEQRAATDLIELLREQREATGAIPSDLTIVIERFRDEIGDWRLCVLSPFGGRVHSGWALALSATLREELGIEADAIASDDGIVVHLPDMDEPPRAELALIAPDAVEDLIVGELSGSAMFGARFRESAARALLIPRARPGKRTPLWQQRLKAQSLLQVARRYSQFPIVLEAYRECLSDVLDLRGLREVLTKLQRRQIAVVEVETPTASPFAASLLFDFLATYMYEGDTPSAERRAAALSLDRDLLRELLGQEELRELIDADALAEIEADLQCLSQRTQAKNAEELLDVLRRVGDLTETELSRRAVDGLDVPAALASLRSRRRAVALRIGSEQRWIDAADAGLYRDALGVVLPPGLPGEFLDEVPAALTQLLRRYAASNGPFTSEQPAVRYRLGRATVESACAELEERGALVRGELRPGGVSGQREWCEVEVLRRLRRASLAALRKEIEPVPAQTFAAFQASWHGIDAQPAAGAGIERLREQLVSLQCLPLTPASWEKDVLPRRLGAYSPSWLDALCSSGELVWVGAGPLGRNDGRVSLYFREDVAAIGPPPGLPERPQGAIHEALLARLGGGACFFGDLLTGAAEPLLVQEALWDLVWAGLVTNDSFAPLRGARLTPASLARRAQPRGGRRSGSRFASRRGLAAASHLPGRWSLTAPLFAPGDGDPAGRRRTLAELLLERYGVLTRELVRSEGIQGGFAGLYSELVRLETVGAARRGYFVEGLGGAQFALPGAVERLRSQRLADEHEQVALVLPATDPAQPYGAALPWPEQARRRQGRGPGRVPGAHLVLVDWLPALYLERGGRSLLTLVDSDSKALMPALTALAGAAREGRIGRLAIERLDGELALGSALEPALIELGFDPGPRRLTLRASA
ncbi:MAG TPA: DEAD/DEAH box helicase [Solirubrobacteraceae bacterium]|jgi:ATP-dependent Lhr-like helicase